jgi:HAD superfamily hydrolase (TIGR01450 family)
MANVSKPQPSSKSGVPAHTMAHPDLSAIRHLALDLDGTIYRGKTLFPFTCPFLQRVSALGLGYTFLTNNSSKSVADYVKHLGEMGIPTRPDQIYTSTLATMAYLRRQHRGLTRAFIVGTPSMIAEFEQQGFHHTSDHPEVVVVGFDPAVDFARLCRAGYWIAQGKPFIATHPDRICPTDQQTLLIDCGAVCAALQSATGRAPDMVLGKPHPIMLEEILRRHKIGARELAVVGDRVYTDVAMAKRIGALGVLVLTGETTRDVSATAVPAPDLVLPSVEELGNLLRAAHDRDSRSADPSPNPSVVAHGQ